MWMVAPATLSMAIGIAAANVVNQVVPCMVGVVLTDSLAQLQAIRQVQVNFLLGNKTKRRWMQWHI